MNDLNMLLSCFIEKMPALSLPFFLPVAFPSLLSLRPSLPSPRTQLISPRGTSLVCHRRHRILQSELWAGRGRRGHTSQVFILQRRDDRPCFDIAGFYPGFFWFKHACEEDMFGSSWAVSLWSQIHTVRR